MRRLRRGYATGLQPQRARAKVACHHIEPKPGSQPAAGKAHPSHQERRAPPGAGCEPHGPHPPRSRGPNHDERERPAHPRPVRPTREHPPAISPDRPHPRSVHPRGAPPPRRSRHRTGHRRQTADHARSHSRSSDTGPAWSGRSEPSPRPGCAALPCGSTRGPGLVGANQARIVSHRTAQGDLGARRSRDWGSGFAPGLGLVPRLSA